MSNLITSLRRRPALLIAWTALLAACAIELVILLALSEGRFNYSLDDPYIHLTLAKQITGGTYGINPGEASSPASSVIWPFLLVPFVAVGVGTLAPLAINLAATLVSLALLDGLLRRALADRLAGRFEPLAALLLCAFTLATNLIGLIFTGMEHSLQVMIALAVVRGMIELVQDGAPPWYFAPALVIGPLVRYECLALTAPALLLLLSRRRFGLAAGVGLLVALSLGSFSLYLRSLGLDALPASVQAKAFESLPGVSWLPVEPTLQRLLSTRDGALLRIATALLICRLVALPSASADRDLAGCFSFAALLHLLVGRFGWFGRYEIYIWAASLAGLIYLYRAQLAGLFERLGQARAAVTLATVVVLGCSTYLMPTMQTPAAARDTYLQQYQMSRFVADYYRGPVAVNDIGWVAFGGDTYVLDLYGLASAEALRMRLSRSDPQWMADLAASRGAGLAMIYDRWFPRLPSGWQRVAELRLPGPPVAAADRTVAFYITSPAYEPAIRSALARFAADLPADASLHLIDQAAGLSAAP